MSTSDGPMTHGLSVEPSQGWNPRALLAFGVAAVVTLPVALWKPLADGAPFSWFVGVIVGAGVYSLVSERDIRQMELAEVVLTERAGEPV